MTVVVIVFLLVINCFIAGTIIGIVYGAMTADRPPRPKLRDRLNCLLGAVIEDQRNFKG